VTIARTARDAIETRHDQFLYVASHALPKPIFWEATGPKNAKYQSE